MGMSIEQIIKYLPTPLCDDTVIGKEKQKEYDAHDSAVIILHKYQKIKEIIADWKSDGSAFEMSESYWLQLISEVLEDGNVIDISDGMLELTLYKFRKWLGSVPRELQNRRIKHKPYKGG